MKKYKYVHLDINKFVGAKSEEHQQIIDEYARLYLNNEMQILIDAEDSLDL